MQQFDVVVIGAGPGGYVAAIRAAQLGFKVACIEKWLNPEGNPSLGGTCLNVGCIPSKALLQSSENFHALSHDFEKHGISADNISIDVTKMMDRKKTIVSQLCKGIEGLFKKNKVTWLKGHGQFVKNHGETIELQVQGTDGTTENVIAKNVIIATGSKARHLPIATVDNEYICDNEGGLSFAQAPKKMGVIGSGVIGLELGSVWKRLGADVTILEAAPTFLAAADESVQKETFKIFTKEQGLDIQLGVKINSIVNNKEKGVEINYEKDGVAQTLNVERLIVSVGRTANTEGLNLNAIGLTTDERGCVPINEACQTGVKNVYAIGDVVRGPMLAHKAEDEGVYVAEIIAGQHPHINYDCIPWVIYTSPEIAWAGKTEQQLKAENREYKTGQFSFMANGRALGQGSAKGFVKMIACKHTDEVLGVHVVHQNACELIAEAVVAMEFSASSEDIARIIHAHPSLSEAMKEAALAVDKRAIHM